MSTYKRGCNHPRVEKYLNSLKEQLSPCRPIPLDKQNFGGGDSFVTIGNKLFVGVARWKQYIKVTHLMNYLLSFLSFIFLLSCQSPSKTNVAQASLTVEPTALTDTDKLQLDTATFAGGCFWCTEAVFERVRGVRSVVSGYTGGEQTNPTYEAVSAGKTSHAEGVQVYYDPNEITYQDLVKIFFGTHDPTQLNRQGPDVGEQYRSAVYYHNPQQKEAVEAYVKELGNSGKYAQPIVTQIEPFKAFYDAEGYHQNYYENNPNNPYIMSVAKPKVKKLLKNFPEYLKDKVSA